MTKEERNDAIEFFKKVAEKEVDDARYSRLAIEALEQEPCDDEGIAFKSITTAFQIGLAFGFAKKYDEMDKVMELLKKAVAPKPKKGHWIVLDEKSAVCSCCYRNNTPYGYFCQWCGKKLAEPQESEDEE